jgi:hypothetical protein
MGGVARIQKSVAGYEGEEEEEGCMVGIHGGGIEEDVELLGTCSCA